MKIIILIPAISFIAIFCTGNKLKIGENQHQQKFEIFCWCFQSFSYKKQDTPRALYTCETFARVKAKELIAMKHKFYETDDSVVINKISSLIYSVPFSSPLQSDYAPDARLVFVLQKGNSNADTITYINNSTLYVSNNRILKYSLNVMDSIRNIIDKNEIICNQ